MDMAAAYKFQGIYSMTQGDQVLRPSRKNQIQDKMHDAMDDTINLYMTQ